MSRSLYVLAPLVVFSLSIPLAALAVVTTTLAFSTLFIRLLIVYFELGIALVNSWLFVNDTTKSLVIPRLALTPSTEAIPHHPKQHRRRSSGGFAVKDVPTGHKPPRKSESFASLIFPSAPDRDFEGVGGWSLAPGEDGDAWMGLNSRLQLPTPGGDHRRRHHHRSLTSQSQRAAAGLETFRPNPVETRSKTPSVLDGGRSPEGYFNMGGDEVIIMSPEEIAAMTRMDERQRSLESSGTSSPVTRKHRSASEKRAHVSL